MSKNIAVFASGNGTNFQNLVEAEKGNLLNGRVKLLISDKAEAYVNVRAKSEQIPNFIFDPKKYSNKNEYEQILVDILQEYKVDLIVLAGYMRIVGETLTSSFPNKIINLHPSLLPAFKGKNAIEQALDYGVKVTGVTVHFVDEGMDTGPIIRQMVIPISEEETLESLSSKIHQAEYNLLIESVNLILSEKYSIRGRNVLIY